MSRSWACCDEGTAIETSLTEPVQVILHKKSDLGGTIVEGLNYPLLETDTEYVIHGFSYANYLSALGPSAQSDIYSKSSIDGATRFARHAIFL